MGSTLGCRVHFFANEKTTIRLQAWIKKRHKQTLTDFSLLEDWNDLLVLTGQVSYDHLLVIISARPGTLSYDSSFEKLPRQLVKYFSNNSFIVLYPNQSGEPLIRLSSLSYILIPKPDITKRSVNGFTGGLRKRDKIRIEKFRLIYKYRHIYLYLYH